MLRAKLGCAAVCVNPIHVALARRLLGGSPVLVVGVVGFPFGATHTAVKVLETELAIEDGADEIDMVVAIGHLRDGQFEFVESDIAAVVHAAAGRPVKAILECGLLTDPEKEQGAEIAIKAGAAFVKTSTGFLGSGATVHDVTLLRRAVGTRSSVKAAQIAVLRDEATRIDSGERTSGGIAPDKGQRSTHA